MIRKTIHTVALLWILFFSIGCLEVVEEEQNTSPDLTLIKQSTLLSADAETLYVNVGKRGVDMFDVSDPQSPRLLRNYTMEDVTYALAQKGSRLFLANGMEGVEIVDVSDPATAGRIAYIRTGEENATAVALSHDGKSLAVGTERGILLYDIDNITVPRFLGDFDTNGTIRDLCFSADDRMLYLANFDYGLELLDITRPQSIRRLSAVAVEGSACDIVPVPHATPPLLYLASLTSTVKAIGTEDPQEPTVCYLYDPHDGSQIWNMHFSERTRRLYLAKALRGFEIVTVDSDGKATRMAAYDTNGTARGIAVDLQEHYLYVADGKEGLKIFDISEPEQIKRISVTPF